MAYKALLNNQIFFETGSDDLVLTSAKLDRAVGSAGSFTFVIPTSNKYYGQFHKIIDYVDVYRDNDLMLSGRVYSIEETFDTQLKVTCEGLLTILNDSVFRPVTFQGDLHDLVRDLLDSHNAQVEAEKQIQTGYLFIGNDPCYRAYQNYESTISRVQDLVESYGGWVRIRKTNGSLYFDWYDQNRDGVDQTIDFGQNLLDIKQEENSDGVCTVLIPLGAANENNNVRVNITSVNNGKDYLVADQQYINQYGYVVGTHIWDDVTVPSILKTKGQNWLNACVTPKRTINLTAVDLADAGYDVESFRPGQVIKVRSAPHGIDGEWFDCNTQSLDLLHPENNKLSLGTQQIGFIKASRTESAQVNRTLEQIVASYATKSYLELAQENLTQILQGADGGIFLQRDTNGDGLIDEVLIMDTPDVDTARNVWRINQNGWGHSSTGIEGPYTMGASLDDSFVAKFIQAGYLNADLIRTGIIRGQTGNTYWNLNTGEFHLEGQFNVDKSKVFIRQPVVPYYEGDLWVTGYNTNSAVAGYAVAGQSIAGTEGQDTGLGAIKTCMYTRTTGSFDTSDWQLVTDTIDTDTITLLETRISAAEVNIAQNTANINLKASSTELEEESHRIDAVEVDIDGINSTIDLLATEVQTVADKSKTFRSEPVPPYEDGDTWITGNESYNAYAGRAVAGRAIAQWGGEIWVCTQTKTAGQAFDREDWIPATKYINDSQLYGVRQEIRTAEVAIDAANARIDLKADSTTVTALATRVRSAEIAIDGANAKIELKASASDVTALANRVTTAEIAIDAQAGQISSKVSQTDYTGSTIASLINQSATTVKIQAQHINLEGAVTISSLDSTLRTRVNTSLKGTVSCYYRTTTQGTPASPASAVTSTAVDTNNIWTLVMPRPKQNCYFYTCQQYTAEDNTVSWSAVREIANASYTSKWCSSTNATYIDGGQIYTGTVTAAQIKADETFSQHITAQNLDIRGGTINVGATGLDDSYVHLNYRAVSSWFGARYCGFLIDNGSQYMQTYWGFETNEDKTLVVNQHISFDKVLQGQPRYRSWLSSDMLIFEGGSNNKVWMSAESLLYQFGSSSHQAVIDKYGNYSRVAADIFYSTQNSYTGSDRNLKKNIVPLDKEKSAEWVYAQNPVEYQFRVEEDSDPTHHGLIAQKVEETVSDRWGIVGDMDGKKCLSYTEIIADLIATAQTLNDRIKVLEEKNGS